MAERTRLMPALAGYVARRLLAGVVVLWGAATVTFVALHRIGGDPVDAVVGPTVSPTPGLRRQITQEYGFDQPLIVQYGRWLGRLIGGDLGRSYQLGRPVTAVLADQVWPTCALALSAVLLASVSAVVTALATAGRGRVVRGLVSGAELAVVSLPSFWLGLLALSFLSFRWHLFPVAGDQGFAALVLPAVTLALPVAGVLAQVLRQCLDEALTQPFVLTVRTRGVPEALVLTRHALRHAAIPVVTLAGWVVGSLLGGAVLIETVFARPGLGRVLLAAVGSKDTPVVAAIVLLSAAAFTCVNLLVDLAYPALDPRLRTAPTAHRTRPKPTTAAKESPV
ncbi:ABC transporter permease [Embleya sp. NPDC008237]|uniref:ABC transporter permease n=1 Tax=Embleya sp. NPDC008237 TaxID=3363978 RepID=UPI0036E4B954